MAAACDAIQTQRWNGVEEAFEDFYYHSDDLSSVRALTDDEGELVELYDYHEYGLPTITDPNTIVNGRPALLASSAFGNPFLFTGQVYDPETRLYHYRTRPYEPRMGRFISIDSIGVWGDEANLGNGYAYVGSAPTKMIDPSGQLGIGALVAVRQLDGRPSRKSGTGIGVLGCMNCIFSTQCPPGSGPSGGPCSTP